MQCFWTAAVSWAFILKIILFYQKIENDKQNKAQCKAESLLQIMYILALNFLQKNSLRCDRYTRIVYDVTGLLE